MATIGVASLVVTASVVDSRQSFSLGVSPGAVIAELQPRAKLCQGPIDVADEFERVTLTLGTFMQRGPSLAVEVRDADSRAILASGRLASGYPDNEESQVRTGLVRRGARITVCVTNRGIRRVAAYGAGDAAHLGSTASVDGAPVGADMTMRFLYERPRSLLRLTPAMFDRASLFAPSWLSAWMLWALLGLVALAVPGLLTCALARAADEPPSHKPRED